jgi:hypothetical protein
MHPSEAQALVVRAQVDLPVGDLQVPELPVPVGLACRCFVSPRTSQLDASAEAPAVRVAGAMLMVLMP